MKVSPLISSFNSGELSPLMAGRSDIKYYNSACRKIRNFIPTPQGPARRRPGNRFVAEVKDSSKRTWLARFEFNIEQAYVMEFGHNYVRFFSNHGVVGAPLELATPYSESDMLSDSGSFLLSFVQSNDVVYVLHESYKPRKITRTGASTFTIAAASFTGGPFKDVDPASATTVYASASTGSVDLTASSAIFLSGHVGSLFLLEQKNSDNIRQWESGKSITAGDVRRSDGKNYEALNTATTGTVKPIHSVGDAYDGDTGVQWRFLDAGYGWVEITSIGGGGTTAVGTVMSRIPNNAVGSGNATTRWAHSAWSDVEGWPQHGTFFRDRLALSRDQKVWLSVAGDYESMSARDDSGMIVADMAISLEIVSDRSNRIEWMVPSDNALLIGTAGDEHALAEITSSEAFGPGNVKASKQTEYGSRHASVVRVGDGVLFVQKAGRKVRDMKFSIEKEGYIAPDVTVLAEHVTRGGIIAMAYQQEPDSVVWACRSDGVLLGFTLNREQDVRGWHPHRIAGNFAGGFAVVESVCVIPSPDADRDELWMIVKRTINGATKRYVEWAEQHLDDADPIDYSFYVDSGLSYYGTRAATLTPGTGATVKGTTGVVFTASAAVFTSADVGKEIHYRYSEVSSTGETVWYKSVAKITGYTDTTHVTATILVVWESLTAIASGSWHVTTTSISGLSHLEGQTVKLLVDGAVHPDRAVSGGAIAALDFGGSIIHVGLHENAVISPMPIDAGTASGTSQGKTQRYSKVSFNFFRTLGVLYGSDEDKQLDRIEFRSGSGAMNVSNDLFTGVKTLPMPSGYENPAKITVVQDKPYPCTLVSIAPQLQSADP